LENRLRENMGYGRGGRYGGEWSMVGSWGKGYGGVGECGRFSSMEVWHDRGEKVWRGWRVWWVHGIESERGERIEIESERWERGDGNLGKI
jgi:hypothetical protein